MTVTCRGWPQTPAFQIRPPLSSNSTVRCPRRFRTANGCRRVLDSHRLVESVACKRQVVDCAMQQLDAAVLDSDCIARPGLCDHFPRCVVRGKMRKCACQRLLEVSETATSPLRTAFVIALLMALGGVLSARGFKNTFNYGHGQG